MDKNAFHSAIQECVLHLEEELTQIRTGRPTPEFLHSVRVDAYGSMSPLKNIASVSVADARSMLIQPWDKSLTASILKGILAANLSVTATAEGDHVRVTLPDMTEERRRDYIKVMKEVVESERVAVRSVRQKFMKEIEEEVKNGLSEDEGKRVKEEIEKTAKETNETIEEMMKKKEADLMVI